MSIIRDTLNGKLRGVEPFKLVVGSVASSFAVWLALKLLTSEESLKSIAIKLFFKALRVVPGGQQKIEGELKKIITKIEKDMDVLHAPKHKVIPEHAMSREEILALMQECKDLEGNWKEGRISGVVYSGDTEHHKFLNEAYSMFSHTNPLHPDVFPSVRKFEAEIIAMTANMLGGNAETCGVVTSGGTESIIMAVKAYRDFALSRNPNLKKPEIIVPVTAHAAFDKAAHYFGLKIIHVPVGPDFAADVEGMRKQITANTILLVGSAPGYPHGIIDPIEKLGALAREYNLPLHVDGCLGGFLLPWMKKLGYPIPNFDFSVPEVTSISADTHKYGYASKGTSVLLYRSPEIRKHMYFVQTEWPGGVYASPAVAGSRPGGLIAACYAAMLKIGQDGYLKHADDIAKATQQIVAGIKNIKGLKVLGNPQAMVVAFAAEDFDIFRMMDALKKKGGWILNVLQKPNSLHICVTQRHVGHVEEFLKDLKEATEELQANPTLHKDGSAPVYGLATGLPERSIIKDVVCGVLDAMLKAY